MCNYKTDSQVNSISTFSKKAHESATAVQKFVLLDHLSKTYSTSGIPACSFHHINQNYFSTVNFQGFNQPGSYISDCFFTSSVETGQFSKTTIGHGKQMFKSHNFKML